MTTPSSNPFNPSSNAQNGAMILSQSPSRMALDNLIRRELKVSDPNDPKLVAEALMSRYKDTPKAAAITREAQGVPFLMTSTPVPQMMQASTSSQVELQQAIDDIERDLQELTTNSILKDVTVELQGWASAIRSAISEGVSAARLSIDPRQRDKAFGIRRTLGDYARIARLVGAMTPALNTVYRKFAQSLDELASVMLVMMGEALASAGFNSGRFLMQVPYSELQVRRDAVIYALRNLVGATQEAYGPNDWPRGLDAYRRLFDELERQGQGDLRALLIETELAQIMDTLIQRAGHGRAEGLRQLGSTAQIDLQRFRRLVITGQRLIRPESPPLVTFLSALQLFADAFENSGGFRLTKIARPPILFYGLYGNTGIDEFEIGLMQLIIQRGLLADQLDCFLNCGCSAEAVQCQIMLDKMLYDLDRAIDLYAVSSESFGLPERRAAAYHFLIDCFITPLPNTSVARIRNAATLQNPLIPLVGLPDTPGGTLNIVKGLLSPKLSSDEIRNMIGELVFFSESILNTLRTSNGPGGNLCNMPTQGGQPINLCSNGGNNQQPGIPAKLNAVRTSTSIDTAVIELFQLAQLGQAWLIQNNVDVPPFPSVWDDFLKILQQELCVQRDMETRWENLVRTMAPSCVRFSDVFQVMREWHDHAIARVGGVPCERFDIKLPPHFETSLDSIAQDVDSDGSGRR